MTFASRALLALLIALTGFSSVFAGEKSFVEPDRKANTAAIHEYFRRVTERIKDEALADVETLEDWQELRPKLRRRVLEMLGLWPLPERTDLQPVITGMVEHEDFVVEKLHFQSLPGLYVTANFYRPKEVDEPLPTILYLCGHGRVKRDGVSYGNKAHYQHHPAWFVRHGYCSLVIDTLQLGEIEGMHHGLYRHGKWWWLARGYTPAGVEAWNSMRAVDYLETRKEVDAKRIGVTGRSGGGTYSWWLAAIDDRPACFVPVAGIVDYTSHVVDGCVEGHCDCNYFPNIHQIDTPMYAALTAPRPLLLSNTDKDGIFPLDGVVRVHSKLKTVYDLYDASDKLGLLITEGPHADTQQLRVPAFKWMDRWLKDGKDVPITQYADKPFEPEQLKVFDEFPEDERNTTIDETFVSQAEIPEPPTSLADWKKLRQDWLAKLQQKSLSGWPDDPPALDVKTVVDEESKGVSLSVLEYTSDENLRFPLFLVHGTKHAKPSLLVVTVVDDEGWNDWRSTFATAFPKLLGGEGVEPDAKAFESERKMMERFDWAFAVVPPRGIGPNQWTQDPRKAVHVRRRFSILGKSLDEGRIWDVRRAIHALRGQAELKKARLWLQGRGVSAGLALYAGLFEPDVERFDLHAPPTTHREGPILLNVLRVLDLPQAMALALPRTVVVYDSDEEAWSWTKSVAELHETKKRAVQFRTLKEE